TTTPWTLPGNTGIMAHPDFDYAYVQTGNETLVMAKELVDKVMQKAKLDKFKIVKTVKGKDLEGVQYEHPLLDLVPAFAAVRNSHRVVLSARYVSIEEGTGLVHTAPGHGAEDFRVGKENGLALICPLNLDGTFTKEAGVWLEGNYAKSADGIIIKRLLERHALLAKESVSHEYPTCWRCSTPLLMLAVKQWFFKVTAFRDQLLAENKKVNWVPAWAKTRFDDWMNNLGDWPVSRQRYWGIPLPIWTCACGNIDVIGSAAELKQKSGLAKDIDFHRPAIDAVKIKCGKCAKPMERVKDVLDVWFDSGVASWASLGFPADRKLKEKLWPSDFQVEGPDQFRGWWNSQMITSYMTFGQAPFKNVLLHGFILDAKGIKMSKSKGNIVSPEEVIKKHGRDVLRFYLLSFPAWEDFYFKWESLKETETVFSILYNCFQFGQTYAPADVAKPQQLLPEDRWILSRLAGVATAGKEALANYHIHLHAKALSDFILNDLSRWYIKLVRERLSPGYAGKDRAGAVYAFRLALQQTCIMLAPLSPFLADHMYRQLFQGQASVHFADWPTPAKPDKGLEQAMALAQQLVEAANALRQEKGVKLRWPLDAIKVEMKDSDAQLLSQVQDAVCFMANCKQLVIGKLPDGKQTAFGKIAIGQPLMEEAILREVIRQVQVLRKGAGLAVTDLIELTLATDVATAAILKKQEKELAKGVNAAKVSFGPVLDKKGALELAGKTVEIGFRTGQHIG
ncbi:MAG: isoleucine--tRNA ligase, partial [Candidatus Aenigmarchaeota archaeon]|nr:isoleucine--tRNA ligase [Candidatus Aenigmarchaeota archaeon]